MKLEHMGKDFFFLMIKKKNNKLKQNEILWNIYQSSKEGKMERVRYDESKAENRKPATLPWLSECKLRQRPQKA